MKNKTFIQIILLLSLSSCATIDVKKLSVRRFAPRSSNCRLPILKKLPKTPFSEVALISATSGGLMDYGEHLKKVLPYVKKEICNIGADAIVIKREKVNGHEFGWITQNGKINALAIKFIKK